MHFINDEWLSKRAQSSNKRDNQGSPALVGVLKTEIESLNRRVTSLNSFKNLFFSIQEELIAEKEKNKLLKKVITQQKAGEPIPDAILSKVNNIFYDDSITDDTTETSENTNQSIVCIPSDNDDLALSNDDLEQAKDLILLSLAVTNEYNLLIENLIETEETESYDELVDYILMTLETYHLHGAVQVRSKFNVINKTLDNKKQDEYLAIIEQFKTSGTVYQHENIYLFNKQHVTFLIEGLPDMSEMSYRYIEYIKHVLSAANNKVKALDNQKHLNNQHKNLKSLVDGTHTSIKKIQKASMEQTDNIHSLFDTMGIELSDYLNSIKLQPKDKENVLKFIASKQQGLTESLNDNISLDTKFVSVINQLKHSFSKEK